jgi:uncharacterized membrane protein YtjA (UPF0391 family)
MLKWALFFAVVAVIAGLLGFTGIAAGAAAIAKFLFVVFVILCVVFLVLGFVVTRKMIDERCPSNGLRAARRCGPGSGALYADTNRKGESPCFTMPSSFS